MLKKFLATAVVMSAATVAFAQSATATSWAAGTNAGQSSFNVDLAYPADWLGTDMTVDLSSGTATIVNASGSGPAGSLSAPVTFRSDAAPVATEIDTFINGPGFAPDWFNPVSLATPLANMIATSTHIGSTSGPLTWFDTAVLGAGSHTALRLVLSNGANGAVTTDPLTGPQIGSIFGRFTYNVSGTVTEHQYNIPLYQAPEPSTLALLALGGLAGLIRRR